jgi:uncharacterized membrane protein YcjF (UPF0283 family)
MAETEQEWRRELEAAGEQAVRDSFNFGGGYSMASAQKSEHARQWLRKQEQKRQWYSFWTFAVAILTLLAALAAIVMPYLIHP